MANFLENIDPDDNFLNEVMPSYSNSSMCQYYTVDRYNSSFSSSDSSLTLMNFNIRSFNANSSEFISFLGSLVVVPDIIVLTETWFSVDADAYEIDGYSGCHTVRQRNRGGGVSVYVRSDWNYVKIGACSMCSETIESCTVRFRVGSEFYSVVSVYRPHDDTIRNFNSCLEELLHNTDLRNGKTIVTGDLNINLLNEECANTTSFVSMMQSLNFLPVITKPTKFPSDVQQCRPTVLDHIWINGFKKFISGVFSLDLTDHCPTFISIETTTLDSRKIRVSFRVHTAGAVGNFLHQLEEVQWNFRMNVNEDVIYLVDMLFEIYDRSFPLKVKYIGRKRFDKPWLTTGLIKSIRTKSRYFKLYKLGKISKEFNNAYKNQ